MFVERLWWSADHSALVSSASAEQWSRRSKTQQSCHLTEMYAQKSLVQYTEQEVKWAKNESFTDLVRMCCSSFNSQGNTTETLLSYVSCQPRSWTWIFYKWPNHLITYTLLELKLLFPLPLAIEYIGFLHQQKKKQEEDLDVLRREVMALKIMKAWVSLCDIACLGKYLCTVSYSISDLWEIY